MTNAKTATNTRTPRTRKGQDKRPYEAEETATLQVVLPLSEYASRKVSPVILKLWRLLNSDEQDAIVEIVVESVAQRVTDAMYRHDDSPVTRMVETASTEIFSLQARRNEANRERERAEAAARDEAKP